jgi:nicotinamidase-related amidase
MTVKPTALLVIDVQRGLFTRRTPIYEADRLLDTICSLVTRAQQAKVPVVYVQHESQAVFSKGSGAWQLHPRLRPRRQDLRVPKSRPSAFDGTELATWLDQHKIRRVVLTGLVTQGCVRATTQDGLKRGYEVILVENGHSSFHRQAARLIKEWNAKLAASGARVRQARAVRF